MTMVTHNKINLPKDVLGLYCLSCKNDLEIDSLGNYRCKFCFARIGVLK